MSEHTESDRRIMRKTAKTLARMTCMVNFYLAQGEVTRAEFEEWLEEEGRALEGREFGEIFQEAVEEMERTRLGIGEESAADAEDDFPLFSQVELPAEFDSGGEDD